jgi:hypothetical protein
MRTFDFANPDLSIPQRTETTVPQQALFGLNHPFVVQQAKALVQRATGSAAERIDFIYAQLFQRPASPAERSNTLNFVQVETLPASTQPDHSKAWQYGFGEWDESTGKVKGFQPLPHFNGTAWQGDATWPNAKLGWAQLTASGGHPGNNRKHAVVRRWIAESAGSYDIKSTLIHEPQVGDGIRAFVSHSRLGKLRSTTALGTQVEMHLTAIDFHAGDSLDFSVDIGDGLNSDQFLWAPIITPTPPLTTGSGGDDLNAVWAAEKDFSAQPMSRLTPWEQLVQVLMLSNEFMFVD